MVLNSQLNPNDVKTALDAIVKQEFEYGAAPDFAGAGDPLIFRQETTDRQAVIQEVFKGVGLWTPKAESADADSADAAIGQQKISTVVTYAKTQAISKNFFDDDQHAVVKMMMEDFGDTARLSIDSQAMQIFNNGFTTQKTADDQPLFSASHKNQNGDIVSNLISGALTPETLEDAFVALETQLAQDGTTRGHQPAVLLVHPANFKNAVEITGSVQLANTADNNVNWVSSKYGGMVIKKSPYLTSTTAWFVLGRKHNIIRYKRQGLVTFLRDWTMSNKFEYVYGGEFREVFDTLTYDAAVGSTGV